MSGGVKLDHTLSLLSKIENLIQINLLPNQDYYTFKGQ